MAITRFWSLSNFLCLTLFIFKSHRRSTDFYTFNQLYRRIDKKKKNIFHLWEFRTVSVFKSLKVDKKKKINNVRSTLNSSSCDLPTTTVCKRDVIWYIIRKRYVIQCDTHSTHSTVLHADGDVTYSSSDESVTCRVLVCFRWKSIEKSAGKASTRVARHDGERIHLNDRWRFFDFFALIGRFTGTPPHLTVPRDLSKTFPIHFWMHIFIKKKKLFNL